MPPLELTRNSFYAAEGTAESDALYQKARDGLFSVLRTDLRDEGGRDYLIFEHFSDDEQAAVAAFAMEMDTATLATIEHASPKQQTRTGFLGRLGLR